MFKKLLLASTFLVSMPQASAVLLVNDLEGVEACIKESAYYPGHGYLALNTGFLETLRFNGNFTTAMTAEGQRRFVKDEGLDGVMNVLIKGLFPSTAGQLNPMTTAETNFASYVEISEIAHLINYMYALRHDDQKTVDEKKNTFLSSVKKFALKKLSLKKYNNLLKKTLMPLLNNLSSAMAEEDKGFYVKNTVEQMISAFYWYKFNHKSELVDLLKLLDGRIVDASLLPLSNKRYGDFDKAKILQKKSADWTFEERILLSKYSGPTPYKPGISPLSNGTTQFYDRTLNQSMASKTFADCGEITVRHIFNLITFDSAGKVFNLTFIQKLLDATQLEGPVRASHPLQKLIDFYAIQTLELSNDGSLPMRSAWNQVVGDLNGVRPDIEAVKYVQGNNELDTGFINMLNVMHKVTGLDRSKQIPQFSSDQKVWVADEFKEIFRKLNPLHQYNVQLNNGSSQNNDLHGLINIQVLDQNKNNIFNFDIYSMNCHILIQNLKSNIGLTPDNPWKFLEDFKPKNPLEQALKLLSTNDQELPLVYKLFGQPIQDNEVRIKFLKRLNTLFPEEYTSYSLEILKTGLKNVLSQVSWDDQAIVKEISDTICNIFKHQDFGSIISEYTQALNVSHLYDVTPFKNLKNLTINVEVGDEKFENSSRETIRFTPGASSIKNLNIIGYHARSPYAKIEGLDYLTSIKSLLIAHLNIDDNSSLNFSHNNILDTIKLINLKVSSIIGLDNLAKLEYLKLNKLKSPLSLNFSEKNISLAKIELELSLIKELNNLGDLKEIITVDIWKNELPLKISLSEKNQKLKQIIIEDSEVTLTGQEHLPNLVIRQD